MSLVRSAALAGFALIAGTAAASAASVSYSASYGPGGALQTTDWNANLTLSGFNTSMGSLNSVTVTISDNGAFGGTVTNVSASTQSFAVSEDVKITATGGGFFSGLFTDLLASQNYTLGVGEVGNFGPYTPSQTKTVSSSNASDFGFFTGGDWTAAVGTLTSTTVGGGGGNVASLLATKAAATVTVTYNYAAASVPEPASLALLGGGLLGLGMLRRRRR